MSSGWISIHRSITDHWIWGCEKFTKAQAWLDLLINANHSENKVMIKGELITVNRGQQIRSQTTLSKAWKWDRKTVSKFLKMLEKDKMITINTTHLTTYISVCNYNDFQDKSKNNTQQKGQHSTQAIPSTTDTNNNVNNDNNVNKKTLDYSKWPELPKDQTLKDWVDMRKRLKANVSQTVINNFAKQLQAAIELGYTVDYCLSECITRNWRGFKAEWLENEKNNRNTKRNPTAVERVETACRKREAENANNRQDDLPALGSDGSHLRT